MSLALIDDDDYAVRVLGRRRTPKLLLILRVLTRR